VTPVPLGRHKVAENIHHVAIGKMGAYSLSITTIPIPCPQYLGIAAGL
jgi:hypothetical protein